ncbi:MAG TPA: response regulator transcription factor [Solirubrobacteraceae bacterium]|nr:response regulator transcription factor [Solirubrobacteraceae bacterium]
MPTRVLIVDDHPVFLEAIGMLVERLEGLELAGRIGSGQEAIEVLGGDPPDMVVLDFQLDDMTGLDVLEHITANALPVRVLMLSGRLQGEDAYRIVEGGAHGLVEKSATFDEIADAITRVARGEMVLGGRVQAAVMAGVRERRDQPAVVLSDREQGILEGLARGLTAPDIGRELELSTSTVKTYLQRLYEKLGVSDRAAAVAEGMRRRLIE